MGESEQPFDDPSLKGALRSLRGGHRASARLRQRITNQLAEIKEQQTAHTEHRQNGRWLLALAAVVAITFGLFWINSSDEPTTASHQSSNHPAYSASAYVLNSMVSAHQLGTQSGNGETAPAAPLADAAELGSEATRKLGRSVPVPAMGNDWKLDAAKYCDVYGSSAIRFHFSGAFADKTGSITIVSLPAAAWPGGREGDHYEVTAGNNAIAGYIHDGSLNCVVGDAGMSLPDVTALRDQLRRS